MKTFIPWVGGKTALRPVLYRLFPHSINRYVEVFGGSAALLFGRNPQKGVVEVYNDLNGDLVNLFLCVRDRPMAFCKEVGWLPVNGRVPFEVLRDFLEQKPPDNRFLQEELAVCNDLFPPAEAEELCKILRGKAELWDVKRAAAYYKVIRYSYGAGGTSYGARPVDICRGLGQIHACSRRLKNVVIENLSFDVAISRYDEVGSLLYIDPPYYMAECYEVFFGLLEHLLLHELAYNCKNAFLVISYNDTPTMREGYPGFWQYTTTRPNPLRNRVGGGEYKELILTNFDPEKYAYSPQMTLFQNPVPEPGEKKYIMIQRGEENAELRKQLGAEARRKLREREGILDPCG